VHRGLWEFAVTCRNGREEKKRSLDCSDGDVLGRVRDGTVEVGDRDSPPPPHLQLHARSVLEAGAGDQG
jgi:hypothetical protein